MIRVEDFHKSYGDNTAVDGLSFDVAGGDVLGLIGPNGAGKTTTLRALSGIIPPSQGTLLVDGRDVCREPVETKRRLAYVPDDPPNFGDLTVAEHLAFTASVYRVSDADPKADAVLEDFQLASKRDTAARDLSRGMRQKLAICCAYLHDPSALLLDEPLTGLDPHGIRTLKRTVSERAASGAAVIISSHLLAMVEDVCSHVLILNEGLTQFCGPVEELRATFGCDSDNTSLEEIFFAATA